MLRKRLTGILLVWVFILQLLPIRQAVKYFRADNLVIEEVVHVTKNPVKPAALSEEDHLINDIFTLEHPGIRLLLIQKTAGPVPVIRPQAAEVETPPPNLHFS